MEMRMLCYKRNEHKRNEKIRDIAKVKPLSKTRKREEHQKIGGWCHQIRYKSVKSE